MSQLLPEGALISPADMVRISSALDELNKTRTAHGSLQVQVSLHAHYEYPKHVTVGDKMVVVNSEAEELALSPKPSEADLDADAPPTP